MKKVAIYHKSIPNGKNQEKIDILKFFSEGVRKSGDTPIDCNNYYVQDADIGMIQGWITDDTKNKPHLELRKSAIEFHKYTISADSNLFLYANTNNPFHYLRYSFNGVFPNTGIYCDTEVDPTRWLKISKDLNLSLKDYRKNGSHILLCLQRNGGWSMANYDVQDWTINTVNQLRKYTDRKIILRGHPGDKAANEYLNPNNPKCKIKNLKNIEFSDFKQPLIEDLKNAWAVINHNSSPAVAAVIEGFPVFVTDPEKSQCKEVANLNISEIENPKLPDRTQWINRLSMFHWKFDELKSGECWTHMKKFINE